MFNKQNYKDKTKYRLRKKQCINMLPEKVVYKGQTVTIEMPCPVKFTTRDPNRLFCSDKCRSYFHWRLRRKPR